MSGNANSGRKRGVPTKMTMDVKEQILQVYHGIGGRVNFTRWAKDNETDFYKMFASLVPKQIKADITVRDESTLTDEQLESIITGAGGDGVDEPAQGSQVIN